MGTDWIGPFVPTLSILLIANRGQDVPLTQQHVLPCRPSVTVIIAKRAADFTQDPLRPTSKEFLITPVSPPNRSQVTVSEGETEAEAGAPAPQRRLYDFAPILIVGAEISG